MSIAAQKWAWDQNIPNLAAKFLLVTMADQADARDGSVRHQETTAEFFSQKCSISKSTFWRAVAALEQNRYLRREAHQGRVTDYWLCLDRGLSFPEDWNHEDTRLTVTRVGEEDPCHQRNEPVSPAQLTCVTVDTSIYNQTTKLPKTRAGARDAKKVDGSLKEEGKENTTDPNAFVWASRGTRWWDALEELDPVYLAKVPKHQWGVGKDVNRTGWWFRWSFIQKALRQARATGPPDSADPTDDATSTAGFEDQGGGDNDQSAACV